MASRHNAHMARTEDTHYMQLTVKATKDSVVLAEFPVYRKHLWDRDDSDLINSFVDAGRSRESKYLPIVQYMDAHGRDSVYITRKSTKKVKR